MSGEFSAIPGLPPARQIPIRERSSVVFVERAKLDVVDGAFVSISADGSRTQIPIGAITCLMLEPGVRISHSAIVLAAKTATLIVWVGEAGVRLYSAGNPGGFGTEKLLWQAAIALDMELRLKVVRRMYEVRFDGPPPAKRSIDQLRGIEGARVRESYKVMAQHYGVPWSGRSYDKSDWDDTDVANRCLSSATACLHSLCEAAILIAGYSPAIGFLHTGSPLSFVYDISDLWKTKTVVKIAFKTAGQAERGELHMSADRATRLACRDAFRETHLLEKIIPQISDILSASGINPKRLGAAPGASKL